jgi:hypothetical protein
VPRLLVDWLFSDNCRLVTQSLLEGAGNTRDLLAGNRVAPTYFEIDRSDNFFC